jgi:hypothetical protein
VLLSIASLIKTLLRRTGRAILRYNVLYILPATAPLLVGVIGDLLMDVVYACAILAAVSRTTRCVVCALQHLYSTAAATATARIWAAHIMQVLHAAHACAIPQSCFDEMFC